MPTDLMETIRPLVAEAKALNESLESKGNWVDEAQRERYHELVRAIYLRLEPLLRELLRAGVLTATFYDDRNDGFAWFEVDEIEVAGSINFSGRAALEVTDPPPDLF